MGNKSGGEQDKRETLRASGVIVGRKTKAPQPSLSPPINKEGKKMTKKFIRLLDDFGSPNLIEQDSNKLPTDAEIKEPEYCDYLVDHKCLHKGTPRFKPCSSYSCNPKYMNKQVEKMAEVVNENCIKNRKQCSLYKSCDRCKFEALIKAGYRQVPDKLTVLTNCPCPDCKIFRKTISQDMAEQVKVTKIKPCTMICTQWETWKDQSAQRDHSQKEIEKE